MNGLLFFLGTLPLLFCDDTVVDVAERMEDEKDLTTIPCIMNHFSQTFPGGNRELNEAETARGRDDQSVVVSFVIFSHLVHLSFSFRLCSPTPVLLISSTLHFMFASKHLTELQEHLLLLNCLEAIIPMKAILRG